MFKLTKTYLTRETNKVMKGLIRHREVLDCWVGDSWSKAYINSERKVKSLSKEVDTFNNLIIAKVNKVTYILILSNLHFLTYKGVSNIFAVLIKQIFL